MIGWPLIIKNHTKLYNPIINVIYAPVSLYPGIYVLLESHND